MPLPTTVTWPDLMVPIWLVAAWVGYVLVADHPRRGRTTLMARMHEYRQAWMRRMLGRDNRIVDTQIVSLLVQNISFFASSTILIVGGFVAVLGARDQALGILSEIPFAARTDDTLWDIKILTLIIIFVYAFFKFTWAMRQFNFLSLTIGTAPGKNESPVVIDAFVNRAAALASLAGENSNRGLRAFYFAMSAMSWFLHPVLFMGASALVVGILYHREFKSRTLLALMEPAANKTEATS